MVSDTRASVTYDLAPRVNQPTIERLVDQQLEEFKAALAEHVAAQFQDQERLLEEARRDLKETKRDLALHKEALSNSKRDRRDLEERFEHERQVLGDEIRQLGVSVAHAYEEGPRQGKKALDDGILKLKAIVSPEKRVEYQQNPPPTFADTEQYAMAGEGISAM